MLKDLLRKGDYMAKIDLKNAYLTVPVWKNDQKYLLLLWKGSLLEFASLLRFGLANASRVFAKLLKPVLSILRQRGIRLITYPDDILLMAPSHPLFCQTLKGVFQLRPPQPRYATTWQVSQAVQFISSLAPNNLPSLKLSWSNKLVVGLLALT